MPGLDTATRIPVAVVTQVSRFFNSVSINQRKGAEAIAEHVVCPVWIKCSAIASAPFL
jgi:hypothetical protein